MDRYPGISNGRPKNPDYSMATERLATFKDVATFKDWSTNGISIEELSSAGFYATGSRDSVKCFYCGGGMQHWQQDDDPWIEHARHFPDCDFLKLHVEEEFIKKAHYVDGKDAMESTFGHVKKRLVPDQLIEDLNSKASLLLMEKGYKQEDVEHAIERAREKHGSGDLRAHHILEALLESETFTTPCSKDTFSSSRPTNHMNLSNGYTERPVHVPVNLWGNVSESLGEKTYNDDALDTEQDCLLEENRALKHRITCKICLDNDACIVFIPCGHMVSCRQCAGRQNKCAVCRADIKDTIRAYPA
ncbi:baculoviral IAP repeat-containing protein 2-like isoform X1 [Mercenaria mercenaria]|uniref:baculoviral IAP repeat-containing protein 2-like isoform X1 n=1 Tax=Mercenaria mercenaria TaxID=6596 RepID=UPI00234F2273|nr:baculoviral IAP repeat-containing protein 2-like isoform X1 [Mercenaria mercenaria]